MDLRNLTQSFWIAVSAIAGAIVAGVTVFQLISPTQITLPALVPGPSALTATIESFPYRHAASGFYEQIEEWREQWIKPLEDKLKERKFKPEQLETVVKAVDELVRERIESEERVSFRWNIANADKWYSATIRNNADVPLKDVFLKFPAAYYWIDEKRRLVPTPQRIELGDMDQKSEKNLVLWGNRFGLSFDREDIVLGHSNGIGVVEFN